MIASKAADVMAMRIMDVPIHGSLRAGATIIRSTTDGLLDWVGFDYFTGAISRGFSSLNGAHMIWCDFSGQVDIQVSSANHIRVHNNSSGVRTGRIMFNY